MPLGLSPVWISVMGERNAGAVHLSEFTECVPSADQGCETALSLHVRDNAPGVWFDLDAMVTSHRLLALMRRCAALYSNARLFFVEWF